MPPLTSGFLHGVASFDPLPDAVLLWTRYTPAGATLGGTSGGRVVATRDGASDGGASDGGSVTLEWQVSEHPDFSSSVASGVASTDASKDWTVVVDTTGLQPARRYCYRFACGKERSVTGHTKTAPAGPTQELLFGSVCCSNWAFGRFHVYDLLARVDRLDFVLHCGDYIYEYSKGYYPSRLLQARHGLRPKHECQTLADYRQRYACYRTDPALQELHRRVPMIAVNDDHEIADEANTKGSVNHDGTRKEWEQRKRAGVQAYSEWVPVRGMTRGPGAELEGVHRTLQWGDLMTLLLVENRVSHRSPHVELDQTELYRQTALRDPSQWDEGAILEAKADLMRQLADPHRRLIGEEQVADVRADVAASVAAGRPWQVLLSQTVFSTILAPKLQETVHLQPRPLAWVCSKALKYATSTEKAGEEGARLARMYLGLGTAGAPMNPDAYDGYRAEREQLLEALGVEGAHPIVLAGDSHNAWCHVLRDGAGRRIGAEFDAPAVTSIGAFEDIYTRFVEKVGRWVKPLFPFFLLSPWVEDALHAANPDTLRYCNLGRRGFVLHHVTQRRWHAEFHYVDSVRDKHYKHYCGAAFDVEAGSRGHVHSGLRYLSIGGKIPKREQPRRTALLRLLRGKRAISAPP